MQAGLRHRPADSLTRGLEVAMLGAAQAGAGGEETSSGKQRPAQVGAGGEEASPA